MDQFNKMTVDEKMTILSLNFDQIWGRIFLDKRFQQYYAARSKFDSLISDGGIKLKRMIEESTNGRELWEIPKGRKNTNSETNLECALRELYEETRVRYDQPVEGVVAASITTPTETITVEPRPFKLYPNITFTESYVDCGVIYTTVYYLAIATAPIKTAIKVSYGDQSCEIKDVQWMDLDKIKLLDGDSTINERLTRITKRILTVAKKTTAA
jgi:8-oxo-dGTP pyrophosphatase MutT (NUDIX family)